MVTQVFNLPRIDSHSIETGFLYCFYIFSFLPRSNSFFPLCTSHPYRKGDGDWRLGWVRGRYDSHSTNFDVYLDVSIISFPPWFSVTVVGEHDVFAVWCKTIKYQDNISNSIYDSQESTPTRTRNIQIPNTWDLNKKPKTRKISVCDFSMKLLVYLPMFVYYFRMMIDLMLSCFLLGWYLQLSPLARTLRGARRERSEQLLLESSLITAQCSAFQLRVTPSDPAQDSLPQHTQSSAERDPDTR